MRQDPRCARSAGRILCLEPPVPRRRWVLLRSLDGRRGLCPADHRRVRRAGADVAGVGAAVIVQNVIGGLLALALIVYLLVVLVRPERF
ncbi:K(+)-transporting ATPase subunit F [Pseudonocardia sp. S2-4]|uniref:K(+)-transporting ATPase subunit F n=1 Tax=Pseudonocardia humida TaxID=2800819 RepID=A0ABT1A9N0_9PSEU|nr:K(+)-transporting ATPase subunit F [Pseudonocardia humida]